MEDTGGRHRDGSFVLIFKDKRTVPVSSGTIVNLIVNQDISYVILLSSIIGGIYMERLVMSELKKCIM